MHKPIAIVTGGCGFIASHQVDLLLARGYRVRILDKRIDLADDYVTAFARDPDCELYEVDLTTISKDDPVFKGTKYIFHFAGLGDIVPSINEPSRYMEANVLGTVKVLEGARAANVEKFIYTASSSCYGNLNAEATEESPIDLIHPYALSKYVGEQAALHWHRVYKLPVNSMRIFTAFGPRVKNRNGPGSVMGIFFAQKLAGKPITIRGDGLQRRDWVYVSDIAEAFLAAAESHHVGEIWNVGSGQPQTVKHLAELLDTPIEWIPAIGNEPRVTWGDISKIKRDLGWEPKVSFEEGIVRMLKEMDSFRGGIVWEADTINKASAGWNQHFDKGAA